MIETDALWIQPIDLSTACTYLPNAIHPTILFWLKNLKNQVTNNMLHPNIMSCPVQNYLSIYRTWRSVLERLINTLTIGKSQTQLMSIHSTNVLWVIVVSDIKAKKTNRTESILHRSAREVVRYKYTHSRQPQPQQASYC